MIEFILEDNYVGILDDAVDEELDAIDDIMCGDDEHDGLDILIPEDQLIPNKLVDDEADTSYLYAYSNKEEDYPNE